MKSSHALRSSPDLAFPFFPQRAPKQHPDTGVVPVGRGAALVEADMAAAAKYLAPHRNQSRATVAVA